MVQILPPKTDALGDIGAALGQGFKSGLQDALHGQVQAKRLASAVKGIKSESGYLNNYADLVAAGASPDQINAILPYIQNQAMAEEILKGGGMATTPSPQSGVNFNPAQQQQIPQQVPQAAIGNINIGQPAQLPGQVPSLVSPQALAAEQQIIAPLTPEQIRQAGAREYMTNRARYPGPNGLAEATEFAYKQLLAPSEQQKALIAGGERQRGVEKRIESDLDEKIALKMQKSLPDQLNVVSGELLKQFQDDVRDRVAKGENEKDAVEAVSQKAVEINKDVNSLRNNIGKRPFFGKASAEIYKDIDNLRPKFAKYGENGLNLLDKELQNTLDIGPHRAGLSAFKYSQPIEKSLKSFKEKSNPKDVAKEINESIQPSDSVFAIGYGLGKNGINDKEVVDYLKGLNQAGLSNLSDRQQRELSEYFSLDNPEAQTLGDLFWDSVIPLHWRYFGHALGIYRPKVSPIERLKNTYGKE